MRESINNNRSSTNLGQKITTIFTVIIFFLQTTTSVIAATLSGPMVQADMDNNMLFVRVDNPTYQYDVAEYLQSNSYISARSINSFYERLKSELPDALGEPISVGDGDTIPTVYQSYKLVGSPFVQSRYIRNQIHRLLGLHLINVDDPAYGNETSQLQTLYDNAFNYLVTQRQQAQTELELYNAEIEAGCELRYEPLPCPPLPQEPLLYGVPLDFSEESAPVDMVWPELRIIDGETVLVPIVYLKSATINAFKVVSHEVTFNGATTFESINIDDVNINLGRDAFLKAVNDLTVTHAGIVGSGDMTIVAGGTINLLSSIVKAQGDVNIAANNITAETLVHRYDYGHEQGTRFGAVTSIGSITGDIVVRSYNDIILQGVDITALEGGIKFAADGSIYVGSQQISSNSHTRQGRWKYDRSTVEYLQSFLTAEESIEIIANGQIIIDAAEIVSDNGHIDILAGLGITIEDDLESYSETGSYKKKSSGFFGSKKKKINTSVYQTVAIRALLDAGKNIRLHSAFGDITLKATDITSADGMSVTASGGAVNLLMTTETDHYSYSKVSNNLFTNSTKSKGYANETGIPNAIVGGVVIEALNGVTIEYKGDPTLTLDAQIDAISQFEGMEWMAQVRDQMDTENSLTWQAIRDKHQTWNESNTSLSPAFMAVIVIATAVATAGAGTGPAMAAAMGAVKGGIMAAAISAGTISLITQATLAFGNGVVNNDIGGAMEDFASEETLKNLAISMVTAAAINSIDTAFTSLDTRGVDSLLEAGPATPAMIQNAQDLAEYSLVIQAAEVVIKSAVKSGISALSNGGDFGDYEEVFLNTLALDSIYTIGAEFAQAIGDARRLNISDSGLGIDTATQYIAHAALGCGIGTAVAAINNNSDASDDACLTGAGGAVIGEFAAQEYRKGVKDRLVNWIDERVEDSQNGVVPKIEEVEYQLQLFKAQGVELSRLAAGLTAFAVGVDVNTAADTAGNAAENNALFMLSSLAIIAYVEWVGEGNLLIGLNRIGAGDHPIGKAIDEGITEALEFSMENAPEQTAEALALLKQAGDVVAAGAVWAVTTCDDVAGGACTTVNHSWASLDEQTRNTLKGAGAALTLIVPAGVLTKFKYIDELGDSGYPIEEMIHDVDHDGWRYATNDSKDLITKSIASNVDDIIRVGDYEYTKTAGNHIYDVVKRGDYRDEFVRPYMNSPLTIQEITSSGSGVPDPGGVPGAVRYDVPGNFRGSNGTWELVVHPENKTIYHFNFVN